MTRKRLGILPHPFTVADRRAGYRYDLSILQAEFALTQVVDRPLSGRIFCKRVIRDNLDLARQRIYGLCLGYEDLNDHDRLRADPLIAACVGKQDLEGQQRRREADRGMPLAGKSTLNRLELAKVGADPESPYCKIVADLDGMANLLVDLFLDAHAEPLEEITLDIDPS